MAITIDPTKTLYGAPYFDDFDEDKKYLRILFRPGYSVQARELTQLQTMMQKQIERFGTHMFKEGSMVIPGNIAYDLYQYYIKVDGSVYTLLATDWINYDISDASGLRANVLDFVANPNWSDIDSSTKWYYLFLKYQNSTPGNGPTSFTAGSVITTTAGSDATIISSASAVGTGSCVTINEGVYFSQGYFIKVDTQKLYLEYENSAPSYRVGLKLNQEIYTEADDISLTSNATGSPNYTAPGAHRLRIEGILSKVALGDEDPRSPIGNSTLVDPTFVELLVIQKGNIYKKVDYSDYNIILDTMARRTYDESGDYTVRPFMIDIKEYLDDGANDGVFQMYMYIENVSGFTSPVGNIIKQGTATGTVTYFNSDTGKLQFIKTSTDKFGLGVGNLGAIVLNDGSIDIGSANIKKEYDDLLVPYPKIYGQDLPGSYGALDSQDFSTMIAIGIEPGKAYVRGYEIEKIAKTFIPINKARTTLSVTDGAVATLIGNLLKIDHVKGFINPQTFETVDLYDKYYTTGTVPGTGELSHKIGTALVKSLERVSGVPGTDSAVYDLYIHDIQLLSGKNVEQIKYICKSDFSAHAVAKLWLCTGEIKLDTGTSTLSGYGTRFLRDLKAEDVVVINPDNAERLEFYISSVTDDVTAIIGTATTGFTLADITSPTIFFAEFTELEGTAGNKLIFPMPDSTIKTVSDFYYNTTRLFQVASAVSGGSNIITIGLGGTGLLLTGETFLGGNDNNYIVAKSDGTLVEPINYALSNGGKTCQIEVTDADTYNVIASIQSTTLVARSKTPLPAVTKLISTPEETAQDVILLDKLDVTEIVSIRMSANFSSAPVSTDPDIKSRYTLDSGQRDNVYDFGRIIKKAGTATPNGQILITYACYQHSPPTGNQTFYSVNSYPDYENISVYESASSGLTFNLRDCLDFRPDVDNIDLVQCPKSGYYSYVNYEYYIGRTDIMWLDSSGKFSTTPGVPALKPLSPTGPRDAMVLYKLNVSPYTFRPKEVVPGYIENKRYTMRDIGKLERRIDNLEYYTSLNELEVSTKNLEIRDDQGLDRYKLGYMCDNFKEWGRISDRLNRDCHYTIDPSEQEARPEHKKQNVNLLPDPTTKTGTVVKGDSILLSYDTVKMVEQPYATTTENVNPFNVFTYIGYVKLDPPFDEWFDTEREADQVVPAGGTYDSMKAYNDSFGGVIWNDWDTTWTGTTNTKSKPEVTTQLESAYNMGIQFPLGHYNSNGVPITPETIKAGLLNNVWPGSDKWSPQRIAAAANWASPKIPTPNNTALAWTQTERWTESNTTTLKTTKTGTKIDVGLSEITQNLGDFVVGMDLVQYMRSRDVSYSAKRMKPNTQLYAFFDNVPVSDSCSSLVTDDKGECSGIFGLPGGKFKCGIRTFRLTDQSDNSPNTTTRADVQYQASGIIEKKQNTVLSFRNAEIVTRPVSDEDSVSFTDTVTHEETTIGPWIDPVAQSFLVDSKGGAMITSVEIFFASRDPNASIELQIREMSNGYPSSKILPFGRKVLAPASVSVDPTGAATSTVFEFDSPVYVMDKTEYAICLISDSNGYQIYTATKTPPVADGVARNIIITPTSRAGEDLRTEPYLGSFFASQNSSTWTAVQETDMKFTINKARFFDPALVSRVYGAYGTFTFTNDTTPSQYKVYLPTDALQLNSSVPGKMRVIHPNHGMKTGDIVSIVGIENLGVGSLPDPIVTTTQLLNRSIDSVESDSYIITSIAGNFSLVGNTEYTGHMGGSNMVATMCMRYDVMEMMIGDLVLPETGIQYTATVSEFSDITIQPSVDITANENTYFLTPKRVTVAGGTLKTRCALTTHNENISPMIDSKRFSAILVTNRINNVSESTINVDAFDDIIVYNSGSFAITGNKIIISCGTDEAVANNLFNKFVIGKFIKFGTPGSNAGSYCILEKYIVRDESILPLNTFTVQLVMRETLSDATPTSTIIQKDRYVDDIGPANTTSLCKYITRRMLLQKEATALKIFFGARFPTGSSIDIYYKLIKTNETRDFDSIEYNKAELDNIPPYSTNANDVKDFSALVNGLDPFIAVAIKLVLKADNTSLVPRIVDFRTIALDA